ncbi:MAG TPA: hypothetical protein VMR21_10575 [Vicinamibacteria bacterium]|nr:hypothetical protein [Vicinamibacteria bacterium]
MARVNRLGLAGCLPLALLAVTVLARKWHWLWLVLPLLAVSWVPYLVLHRGRRYRAAERQAWEVEQDRPDHVFSVMPVDGAAPAGGFLRI